MEILIALAILIVAIAGNFLIRRIMKRHDVTSMDMEPERVREAPSNISNQTIQAILADRSRPSNEPLPSLLDKCHPEARSSFAGVEVVRFDGITDVFNRALAMTPYVHNRSFVQIGVRGDGSEILLKLDPEDSNVYVADIDFGYPDKPIPYCSSISDYLKVSWEDSEPRT